MKKILLLAITTAIAANAGFAQTKKKPVAKKTATTTSAKASPGFMRTVNGLEYKLVKNVPGTQMPGVGDYMEFHITSRIGDSVIFESRKMNADKPVPYQVAPPAFKGDLSEGLMMLTVGDSAVFRVPVDSVLKLGNQALPWMKKGVNQKIQYEIAVTKVQSAAQMQAERTAAAQKQVGVDEQLLQDYFKKNNIKPMKTASGLYYTISSKGTGAMPASGDNVTMNYTGRTLDGNPFDSNVDPKFNHVQPFNFMLGKGQVIKGWDEGVALMPQGSKGVLYIPSTMAYGERSPSPLIPANSVLIFDVEVVDVKKP